MNTDSEVDGTVRELEALADSDRKEKAPGYNPTCFRIIGVKVPDQRKLTNALARRLKGAQRDEKLSLARALVDTEIFECQQVAYEMISRDRKLNGSLTLGEILSLRRGFDNWVSVDTFSGHIAGVAWRDGRIRDDIIMDWAGSPDRWIRRSALVATLGLNQKARGGTGDTPRTLMVCEALKGDHDDMVVKALSWALRELSKRDIDAVRDFMERNRELLHGRVKREVGKKLSTGRKNG